MGPLELLDPEPAGLFGREPEYNAFVELHNLIVAGADASGGSASIDFGPEDADRIARERGVDFASDFRDERVVLFEALFEKVLSAGSLDARACRLLGVAAETLSLAPADLRPLHERAFGDAVTAALADDCLDVGERMHLYALQQALGLGAAPAAELYEEQARARLLTTVARVLCDGELTPDEAAGVATAAGALGVSVGAPLTAMLEAAAERWALCSAPLPTLKTTLRLDPGETAHADVPARWANKRWDALRDSFADGLSNADTRHQPFPWHRATFLLRTGRIVLTSRRLVLLDVERPTRSVPLASVCEAVRFADAVLLRLDGDARRLLIELDDEGKTFGHLLARALGAAPDRPKPAPSSAARWRRIGGDDFPVSARAAQRFCEWVAADPSGWEIPGSVTVTGGHVRLENVVGGHTVPIGHIAGVCLSGRTVGVRQTSGTGWVVVFDRREHAQEVCARTWGPLRP